MSRGPGYRWYGPREAFVNSSAIWLEGPTLCDPPPGDLSGIVVVSDGILCHKLSLELYAEMDKRGVAALLMVSSITCPLYGHIYAKTFGPTGEAGGMAIVNVPGSQIIEGTTTAAQYLRTNVPLWSPPAPLPISKTRIEIRVADPEVTSRYQNRSYMSSVNQPAYTAYTRLLATDPQLSKWATAFNSLWWILLIRLLGCGLGVSIALSALAQLREEHNRRESKRSATLEALRR